MTDAEYIALAECAADRLQGTCGSIAALGDEFEEAENNTAFCNKLDDLVFCCTVCGWWSEHSEMSTYATDEWFCSECGEDD